MVNKKADIKPDVKAAQNRGEAVSQMAIPEERLYSRIENQRGIVECGSSTAVSSGSSRLQ
jgi:hypothetical protein